jgi:hypothetical protein
MGAEMKILIQPCRLGYLVSQFDGRTSTRSLLLPDREMALGFASGWANAAGKRSRAFVPIELVKSPDSGAKGPRNPSPL